MKKLLLILLFSLFMVSAFADEYDSLLMHNNADPFTDSSTPNNKGDATEVADVDLDTNVKKFGAGSGHWDGDSGYLYFSDNDDYYFSNGNFTIDFWVRFDSLTLTDMVICGQYESVGRYWNIVKMASDTDNDILFSFSFDTLKGKYYRANWPVEVDTWYHMAFERNGITALIFIDGISQTLVESTAFSTNDVGNVSANLEIGRYGNGQYYSDCYIDEFRISKGIARWTENFTPPTEEYNGVVAAAGQVIVIGG